MIVLAAPSAGGFGDAMPPAPAFPVIFRLCVAVARHAATTGAGVEFSKFPARYPHFVASTLNLSHPTTRFFCAWDRPYATGQFLTPSIFCKNYIHISWYNW